MNEDHRLHAQTTLLNPDYVNVPSTGGGIGVVRGLLGVDNLFEPHAVTSATRSPHMHDSDSNDAISVGSVDTVVEGR